MKKTYVVVVQGVTRAPVREDTLCNFNDKSPWRYSTTDRTEAFATAKRLAANHRTTYVVYEAISVVQPRPVVEVPVIHVS